MILRAAGQLYGRGGEEGATTAKLAKKAGVTEPVLYKYFGSKSGLMQALLADVLETMTEEFRLLADGARDPVDALQRICRGYPELSRTHHLEFEVIHRAVMTATDRTMVRMLREHYEGYVAFLSPIIRKGQKEGSLRCDIKTELAAWHLVNAALGYATTSRIRDGEGEEEERGLADLALAGLMEK